VAVAAALLWPRPQGALKPDEGRVTVPVPAPPPNPAPTPSDEASAGGSPSARLPAAWRTTVGGALDALTPPGRTLAAADRQALIDALARIRLTAGRRGRTRNPAAAAKHARLVEEADRLFRDLLGIGVGEFMARLGAPGNVEDLGAAAP
jgi:hypothetical protein